ncbi:MAG: DUF2911 domain-containing protein [Gemmatimonadaceae bacterium]|nr:DUF2911 domain-containing protein [Gemmatimonadaceae bacterium]
MPLRFRSLVSVATLVAPLASTVPFTLHAQVTGFVSTLGTDTLFVERFTRSGMTGEGVLLRRAPLATITHYSIALNADGSVARFSQVTTKADGSPLATGSVPLVMTFSGDSVMREIQQNGAAVTLRSAVPRGTMPAFGASNVFAQQMIQLAKAGRDVHTIGFGAQATASKADIRMISSDSVEIVNGGFRTGYRVHTDGRIARGDGSLTTQKFVVTPWTSVNIDAIAAAWAARDAAGQSMGAASSRDTLVATVGSAHITLDYGRPAMRGREIWGTLVPMDTTWRFGANAAAQFRTDKTLVIGGTPIDAGFYTLWLYPSSGQSLLIVNAQTGQWGTAYDSKKDVARIAIEKLAPRTKSDERFTVTIEGDRMLMTWDRSGYVVSIKEK